MWYARGRAYPALPKAYRAFPELDPYDDDACKAYMRRAKRKGWFVRTAVTIAAAGIGFVAGIIFMASLNEAISPSGNVNPSVLQLTVAGLIMLVGFLTPFIAGAVASDTMIRRQLKRRLQTAECGGCGYSLLGQQPVDHPDGRRSVRCPECGLNSLVGSGGIPAENLIVESGGSGPVAWQEDDAVNHAIAQEHPILLRHPALRQVGPEHLDRAIAFVTDRRELAQRRAIAIGIVIAVATVAIIVTLALASPMAPRRMFPGYIGLEAVTVAAVLVGTLVGWPLGAWSKRLIRAVSTQRAVEAAINDVASDAASDDRTAPRE